MTWRALAARLYLEEALVAYSYVFVWITLSAGVILYNKYVLTVFGGVGASRNMFKRVLKAHGCCAGNMLKRVLTAPDVCAGSHRIMSCFQVFV
jgi:hypothetical protein